MDHSEYTLEAFYRFLRQGAMEGLLNPAVARSRLKAAEQLFMEITEEEAKDLRRLNLDQLVQRFHKIHDSTVRPEVLELYHKRLTSALYDYFNWLANPAQFHSVGGDGIRKDKRYQNSPQQNDLEQKALEEITLATSDMAKDILSIPLREDMTLYIQNLPLDLSESEARKICGVISALVVDSHKDMNSGAADDE